MYIGRREAMTLKYTDLYRKECDSIMSREVVERVISNPDKQYSEREIILRSKVG